MLIKTPFGKFADEKLQALNYNYINEFTECWVPDNEGAVNLAGRLSHPKTKPSVPVKYIGPLSRFQNSDGEEKHLLILLSGPEPQRSLLEELLTGQLRDYQKPVVLVRGLPGGSGTPDLSTNISVFDHLPAEELNKKIAESFMIISRCGYSTVMDLAAVKKKSILIPTPAQTEQEYLAKHLMKNNFALCIEQKKFKLKAALDLASSFHYKMENFSLENNVDKAVKEFLLQLKSSVKS